jgi:hypothetical protein
VIGDSIPKTGNERKCRMKYEFIEANLLQSELYFQIAGQKSRGITTIPNNTYL